MTRIGIPTGPSQAPIPPGTYVPTRIGLPSGVNDTALVHAARDAGGVGATLVFGDGTYAIDGLIASVAGQHWQVGPKTTIQLRPASNVPVIDITADGVTVGGGGTLDGNKTAQTMPQTGPYGTSGFGIVVGVRARSVARPTVQNLAITNTDWQAVWLDGVTDAVVKDNRVSACFTTPGNVKAIYVYYLQGASRGVNIKGNTVDGVSTQTGCVGVAAVGVVINQLKVVDNTCRVGNAGATATLGIELFTSGGGTITDGVVGGNTVTGTLGSGNNSIIGISMGGVTTAAGLGNSNITCTGNTVRDCHTLSIEVVGSGVSVSSNPQYNCGGISVNAVQVTGGIHGVTVTNNPIVNCVTSFVIALSGGTNGVFGPMVTGNSAHNPAGTGLRATGIVSGMVMSQNSISSPQAGAVLLQGTVTDSTISDNEFVMTGAPANTDAVTLADATIARVNILGNHIKNAPRYGIYNQLATTAVNVKLNTIDGAQRAIQASDVADRWTIDGNTLINNSVRAVGFSVAATNLTLGQNTMYGNAADYFSVAGTTFYPNTDGGHRLPLLDNSSDIGSSSQRHRNLYVAGLAVLPGMQFKGAWAASTAYVAGDVVIANGLPQIATASFTSGVSFNQANWTTWGVTVTSGTTVAPPWGIGVLDDPAKARGTDSATIAIASFPSIFYRLAYAGTASKARCKVVTTAAVNIEISLHTNTGSGDTAYPATKLGGTGSVACPATGDQDISFTGSVSWNAGDWLGIAAASTVPALNAFLSSTLTTNLGLGRCLTGSNFPIESNPSSVPSSLHGQIGRLLNVTLLP